MKKNAEVWNRPPSVFAPSGVSPVAEVDQSAASEDMDGIYKFKRRRGCLYRSPLIANNKPSEPIKVGNFPDDGVSFESNSSLQVPKSRHLYETYLPGYDGVVRRVGLARRRLGRGGRVLFDRFQCWDAPRIPNPNDPLLDGFLRDDSVLVFS